MSEVKEWVDYQGNRHIEIILTRREEIEIPKLTQRWFRRKAADLLGQLQRSKTLRDDKRIVAELKEVVTAASATEEGKSS